MEGVKSEGVNRDGVNSEGVKRGGGTREGAKRGGSKHPAADAMADRSDDVEVTSKPAEQVEDFRRPAKRGKAPARDGGEEDVEMVGRKGVELPHNRFSCSENPFVLTDESTHKKQCKLCYCFVCNRPATGCSEWDNHCHASTSGAQKRLWATMRANAKAMLMLGKSPPVSADYKGPGTKSSPGEVRLGVIKGLGFSLTTGWHAKNLEERKVYFDQNITETPLLDSVWTAIRHSEVTMKRGEVCSVSGVQELLTCLEAAHRGKQINVEIQATFDPTTNTGAFTFEVTLQEKLFRRGNGKNSKLEVDFVSIVKRLTPQQGVSSSVGSSSSPHSAVPQASAANGPLGRVGRVYGASVNGYGGKASLDVTLSGLLDSLSREQENNRIRTGALFSPAKLLTELENLQHRALAEQPACLTVQLLEHQLQDVMWMLEEEMLDGGSMRHLWAELPPHPLAPANGRRRGLFRTCWFSPALDQFTVNNPFRSGMKGGIICDEMGLGKTAVVLALHSLNRPKTPSTGTPLDEKEWGPISDPQAIAQDHLQYPFTSTEAPGSVVSKGTLVVCMLSTVGQWIEEAKSLCGGALSIYPYHGGYRNKDPSFLSQFDLVVTTYGIVQTEAAMDSGLVAATDSGLPPLRRIHWWRVVLDESHTIANPSTETAKAVKKILTNRRWCMTGTPYMSKFSDVNGQLGFIGLEEAINSRDLGGSWRDKDAQAKYVSLLRRVLMRHSSRMTLGGKRILALPPITHKLPLRNNIPMEPFVLFRMRPPWHIRVEELSLPPKKRQAYVRFEKAIQKEFMATRREWRSMKVLTLLSQVRQACSGGLRLTDEAAGSGGFGDGKAAASFAGNGGGYSSSSYGAGGSCGGAFQGKQERQGSSGAGEQAQAGRSEENVPGEVLDVKLKVLVGKLSAFRAKDPSSKSLVFSQFNPSLERVARALTNKGFRFRTITGSMTFSQRNGALKAFANDPLTTVFLLSVGSGAVGINLTRTNHVFFLEPLLNLALEEQAIGRVYRLGQTRPVTELNRSGTFYPQKCNPYRGMTHVRMAQVTKLILTHSVETRMLAMQKKRGSTNGVAGNISNDDAKHLKAEEYNEFFGLQNARGFSA